MAQYSNLKAYIEEKIYENGTQAITGDILQDVLKVMTDDLGEFYQMGGVASPSTDPGTPDAKVIYFATEAGTYTNFGGITIEAGEVALLIFETSWTKETLNVLSSANGGVKTANLADGAVTTEKIAGGAVETAKIANNAVTSGKVADGAIGTAKIADGAIGADKIAANAVESAKIKNGAVTEGKINDGAVTAGKIASNAVTTDKIKDDAVTSDKIANNAVGNDQIASGAVHAGNIADGAVTAPKIGGGAVTSGKIGSGAVTEEKIADGAVTASKIADGAVGSDQLAEGAFSAQNLADGSVTTDKLADDAVTAEKIADGAVTADKFANGSVTTIKLGSGAVTTEKIGDGMVTRQKLADSSVGTSKIIDGAVTTDKVADGAITDAKLENPVSVSQNTSTGHTDINVGGTAYPVASVEEVSQLGQDVYERIDESEKNDFENITTSTELIEGRYIWTDGKIYYHPDGLLNKVSVAQYEQYILEGVGEHLTYEVLSYIILDADDNVIEAGETIPRMTTLDKDVRVNIPKGGVVMYVNNGTLNGTTFAILRNISSKALWDIFSQIGFITDTLSFNFGEIAIEDYIKIDNVYLDRNGSILPYTNFAISILRAYKGQRIKLDFGGTNMTYLALVDDSLTTFTPVIIDTDTTKEYEVANNGLLAFCFGKLLRHNVILEQYRSTEVPISVLPSLSIDRIAADNPSTFPLSPSGIYDFGKGYINSNGSSVASDTIVTTKLIPVKAGVYAYKGLLVNIASIAMYDMDMTFVKAITGNEATSYYGNTTYTTFCVTSNICYISLSVLLSKVNELDLLNIPIHNALFKDSVPQASLLGTYDSATGMLSLDNNVSKYNKRYDINFQYRNNNCNSNGSMIIASISCHPRKYNIKIDYTKPSETKLLPQVTGTLIAPNSSYPIDDVYTPEFPMNVMESQLKIEDDNGYVLSTFNLDGIVYKNLMSFMPAFTIRYKQADGEDLSTLRNLRLFITGSNGVASNLSIKNGSTVIFTYTIVQDKSLGEIYEDIKDGLEEVSGYTFECVFADVENKTGADIVLTKTEGLPFVTELANGYLKTNEKYLDTYPVFIETADKTKHNLQIIVFNNHLIVYMDRFAIIDRLCTEHNGVDSISLNLSEIEVNTLGVYQANSQNCVPSVKGMTSHSIINEVGKTTTYSITVGTISKIKQDLENAGYGNISVEDMIGCIQNTKGIPDKAYYIELDDFLAGFRNILSDNEDDIRIREILMNMGVKLGLVALYSEDYPLWKKIYDGTATIEERERLSNVFTNKEVYVMRGLINSYGWTIGIHNLLSPTDTDIPAMLYDDFVFYLRETIRWHLRCWGKFPMQFIGHKAGIVSPYFNRLLPFYGIPFSVSETVSRFDSTMNGFEFCPLRNGARFIDHTYYDRDRETR